VRESPQGKPFHRLDPCDGKRTQGLSRCSLNEGGFLGGRQQAPAARPADSVKGVSLYMENNARNRLVPTLLAYLGFLTTWGVGQAMVVSIRKSRPTACTRLPAVRFIRHIVRRTSRSLEVTGPARHRVKARPYILSLFYENMGRKNVRKN